MESYIDELKDVSPILQVLVGYILYITRVIVMEIFVKLSLIIAIVKLQIFIQVRFMIGYGLRTENKGN